MNWEGTTAYEDLLDGTQTMFEPTQKRAKRLPEPRLESEESDEDPSCDDEFVAEELRSKGRSKV